MVITVYDTAGATGMHAATNGVPDPTRSVTVCERADTRWCHCPAGAIV